MTEAGIVFAVLGGLTGVVMGIATLLTWVIPPAPTPAERKGYKIAWLVWAIVLGPFLGRVWIEALLS